MSKCKYDGTGVWEGRCTGTREVEPCIGHEKCKDFTPVDDCKWMLNEICVNADCPMRADYCPVPDVEGVCRFEERGADNG